MPDLYSISDIIRTALQRPGVVCLQRPLPPVPFFAQEGEIVQFYKDGVLRALTLEEGALVQHILAQSGEVEGGPVDLQTASFPMYVHEVQAPDGTRIVLSRCLFLKDALAQVLALVEEIPATGGAQYQGCPGYFARNRTGHWFYEYDVSQELPRWLGWELEHILRDADATPDGAYILSCVQPMAYVRDSTLSANPF